MKRLVAACLLFCTAGHGQLPPLPTDKTFKPATVVKGGEQQLKLASVKPNAVTPPAPIYKTLAWDYDPNWLPLVLFQVERTLDLQTWEILGQTNGLTWRTTNFTEYAFFRVGVLMK